MIANIHNILLNVQQTTECSLHNLLQSACMLHWGNSLAQQCDLDMLRIQWNSGHYSTHFSSPLIAYRSMGLVYNVL